MSTKQRTTPPPPTVTLYEIVHEYPHEQRTGGAVPTKQQPATPFRKIAINSRMCTLYDVASANTLTETALLDVLAKRNAYPQLVEALRDALVALPGGSWAHMENADCRCKGCMKERIPALLRSLGEL